VLTALVLARAVASTDELLSRTNDAPRALASDGCAVNHRSTSMGAHKLGYNGFMMVAGLLTSACAGDGSDRIEDQGSAADQTSEASFKAQGGVESSSARRPIVFVAGLLQSAETIAPLVDPLREEGFDVTVYVPPRLGLGDINGYARSVGEVVERVLERTGAEQVDLLGHSQGGVTARRYIQLVKGDAPVNTLVSMGSPQLGSDLGPLVNLLVALGWFEWAEGAKQLAIGSAFLSEMNEKNDPTPGDVRYVAIGTELDEVTKPAFRSGIPGGENVVMQDVCPGREVGHFGLLSDAWVQQVVLSVLAGGAVEGDCDALPVGGAT
jgi:triacylglycerol lipase